MLLKWNPQTRRWEVPFAHHENENPGDGDGASGSGGKDDAAALKAENEALKKKLADVDPRIKAMEDAQRKRDEEAAKREEDKRKKELGADKLLDEKNIALKTATDRLAALEKREAERVDAIFADLPAEVREAIEPLRSQLNLDQWSVLVDKQRGLVAKLIEEPKGANEQEGTGMFFKPGGGEGDKGNTPINPLARKILEDMGRDPEEAGKQIVRRVKDEETGRIVSSFTRQVRHFFKSMNLAPRRPIEVKK